MTSGESRSGGERPILRVSRETPSAPSCPVRTSRSSTLHSTSTVAPDSALPPCSTAAVCSSSRDRFSSQRAVDPWVPSSIHPMRCGTRPLFSVPLTPRCSPSLHARNGSQSPDSVRSSALSVNQVSVPRAGPIGATAPLVCRLHVLGLITQLARPALQQLGSSRMSSSDQRNGLEALNALFVSRGTSPLATSQEHEYRQSQPEAHRRPGRHGDTKPLRQSQVPRGTTTDGCNSQTSNLSERPSPGTLCRGTPRCQRSDGRTTALCRGKLGHRNGIAHVADSTPTGERTTRRGVAPMGPARGTETRSGECGLDLTGTGDQLVMRA